MSDIGASHHFRCDTEFGRYRGIADIGEVPTDQSRFMSTHPGWRPRSSDAIFGLLIKLTVRPRRE
jgi:hypothetical protein